MLKLKKFIKENKIIFILAAVFAVYVAAGLAFHIPCFIREALGVSCPGCGMSRAALAVLRVDLLAALAYHPLIFIMAPLVFMLIFSMKDTKFFTVLLIFFAVIMLAVYFLRLADPADTVAGPNGRGILGLFELFGT